jgi:hypothetical protein
MFTVDELIRRLEEMKDSQSASGFQCDVLPFQLVPYA